MNKLVILAAVLALILPAGIMLALNYDQLQPNSTQPVVKKSGKLLYFYTPT